MLTGEPQTLPVQTQNFRTHFIQDEAAARRSPVQHVVELSPAPSGAGQIFLCKAKFLQFSLAI